ncbi:MAG: YraN family protein [Bacteroidota bacterium]|jgi:putative endonuclease
MHEKQFKGKEGESVAEQVLLAKGLKILHRNWRAGKNEVDIIARHNDLIVFVEVKTRATRHFGNPSEMVSRKQRNNILKAANQFSLEGQSESISMRFDIISVLHTGQEVEAEHIEDAFYPEANQLKNILC